MSWQAHFLTRRVAQLIFILVFSITLVMVIFNVSFKLPPTPQFTPYKIPAQPIVVLSSAIPTLFGEDISISINAAKVQQSLLNIHIVGITFANNIHDSYVILRLENQEELIFQTGDTIAPGIIIKQIMQDGVLISRNGVLERLILPKLDS